VCEETSPAGDSGRGAAAGQADARRELKGALRELDERLRTMVDMFEEDSSLIDHSLDETKSTIINAYQIMKTHVYARDSPLRANTGVWEALKGQEDEFINSYKSASNALQIYKNVLRAYEVQAHEPLRRGDLERMRQDERALGEEREECIKTVKYFQGWFSAFLTVL
jgi:hypothetical protein